jgi:hypothetical protein
VLLIEVFPPYHAIPQNLSARSVVYPRPQALGFVLLDLLAVCGKRPLAVENLMRPLFARHLFVPRPWGLMVMWADTVRRMRAFVIARLGLAAAVPRNLAIAPRGIPNADELAARARQAHPRGRWSAFPGAPRATREQICFFADTAMRAAASGSGGASVVWMRADAVFVEVQTAAACVHRPSRLPGRSESRFSTRDSRRLGSGNREWKPHSCCRSSRALMGTCTLTFR